MLILSHPKDAPLVKSFRFDEGIYHETSLSFPRMFNFYEASISNLAELSSLLLELEDHPNRMVVRGAPTAHAPNKQISRKVVGSNAGIADSPQQWLCIDIDDLSSPVDINLSAKGLLHLARFTAEQLPEEFEAADFHYQFSSSMGIKQGIRLHLWYWLSRPISNEEAKAWLSRSKTQVDPSLYRPSQPHFTAAPIFDPPDADPLEKRSGFQCYESGIVEVSVPSDLEDFVRIEKGTRHSRTKIVTNGTIDVFVIKDLWTDCSLT